MKELIGNNKTMSSREIADLTGKRHDHVLRDCDVLNESYVDLSLPKIGESYYVADNKQKYREYLLTKMQTMDLMTGYNVELRIKVNRRWEELETKPQSTIDNMIADPSFGIKLLTALKDEQEKRSLLEKENAKLQPKADFVDKAVDLGHLSDIGQASKLLKLPYGRNTFFKKLREMGIFFKNRNEPKQEYIDRGYFELRMKNIPRDNHPSFMVTKVLVTVKGLLWLSEKLNGGYSTNCFPQLDIS